MLRSYDRVNPHRVGVGFREGVRLLHFYAEFLTAPNFYTFTLLVFAFSQIFLLRAARVFHVRTHHEYTPLATMDMRAVSARESAQHAVPQSAHPSSVTRPLATVPAATQCVTPRP